MENQSVHTGILDLIGNAGLTVKLVLLILLGLSVLSWAVILTKGVFFKVTLHQNNDFLNLFWKSKSLEDIFSKTDTFHKSPAAQLFKSGYRELQKFTRTSDNTSSVSELDNVQRALFRASSQEMAQLEKYISILATTASSAPFIGLFGTVWGIMNAFQKIGAEGQASLAVVAPGISEALIATAVGLAAAIPAVMAYNHFIQKIKKISNDMECFSQDFLNIVQRGILTGKK